MRPAHGRMRSLTGAEARVIQVLLADLPGPERRFVRDAEVPRTTYQTIRHRAFLQGWLKERYIPHPALFDAGRIRFVLAQPFAEKWRGSIRELRSSENVAVLWASPETLFGVIFDAGRSREWDQLSSSDYFRRSWSVAPEDAARGTLAYFDYEGMWSSLALNAHPAAYPRTFRETLPSEPLRSRADWREIRGLLSRPFDIASDRSGPMRFSQSRLSRHERRLLEQGWVSRRILPEFSLIPPLNGRRPERIAFVTGVIRSERSPRSLFADLLQRAHVAPFLFAHDTERVLLCAMSPAPPRISESRSSVVDVLQEHIERIEVVREPIESLFSLIDHRYDRLPMPGGT